MAKVIFFLTVITAGIIAVSAYFYGALVPKPVATSVIAEKPGKQVGNQAAVVLPATLSSKQHRLLNLAYEVAKETGFRSPEMVQAVLLQETQAGGMRSYRVANPGRDAYFGPMQVKLSAARDVLMANPSMWSKYNFHTRTDDEVKANLILNDRFNIDIAARYLALLNRQYGFTGRDLLNAYNRGPGGVRFVGSDFHYAVSAEKKLATWKGRR
jgi:hypothetical protein